MAVMFSQPQLILTMIRNMTVDGNLVKCCFKLLFYCCPTEKHKMYHQRDELLAKDGFKKFMKYESCGYDSCRYSNSSNHIHCIRLGEWPWRRAAPYIQSCVINYFTNFPQFIFASFHSLFSHPCSASGCNVNLTCISDD